MTRIVVKFCLGFIGRYFISLLDYGKNIYVVPSESLFVPFKVYNEFTTDLKLEHELTAARRH